MKPLLRKVSIAPVSTRSIELRLIDIDMPDDAAPANVMLTPQVDPSAVPDARVETTADGLTLLQALRLSPSCGWPH